jgi:hypothetical protein
VNPRPRLGHLVAIPARGSPPPPTDIAGVDLVGAPCRIEMKEEGPATLLLFLSSSCDGCRALWEAAGSRSPLGVRDGDRVVVVVADQGREDIAAVRSLSRSVSPSPSVVVSSAAWGDYQVHGAPFFALVAGAAVVCEGVAIGVEQVADDVRRALGKI